MCEILCRGKRRDNGEWVEGYYIRTSCSEIEAVIIPTSAFAERNRNLRLEVDEWWEVDPDTICRYTGSTDKNGKKIYEGDVVRAWSGFLDRVVYENGCFMMELQIYHYEWSYQTPEQMEVVGNIYDNQELLKGVR